MRPSFLMPARRLLPGLLLACTAAQAPAAAAAVITPPVAAPAAAVITPPVAAPAAAVITTAVADRDAAAAERLPHRGAPPAERQRKGRDTAQVMTPVRDWLVLGPVALPLPAFAETGGSTAGSAPAAAAAGLLELPPLAARASWPAAGDDVAWPDGRTLTWRPAAHAAGGAILTGAERDTVRFEAPDAGGAGVAYLTTYLETDRFTKATLSVSSAQLLRVFLNDVQVAVKRGTGTGAATAELALTPGKHALVVLAVREPAATAATDGAASGGSAEDVWFVAATLSQAPDAAAVRATTAADRPLRIADLLDTEAVSSIDLSADGELLAVTMRQPEVPAPSQESWVEVRRVRDGEPVRVFRGNSPVQSFSWAPAGQAFAYVTRRDGRTTLWAGSMDGGVHSVLRDVERFGSYRWLPDGRGFVYSVSTEAPHDASGLRRMQGLQDRWAGSRSQSHLYHATADGAVVRRLTAGAETTSLHDVSPDGRRVLLSRGRFLAERPYSEAELYELDLATLHATQLARYTWSGRALYSPDGEHVLLLGGPSMFGPLGVNLPAGMTPNEYDTQAYILERRGGSVRAATRDFDPAVQQAVWSRTDGMIYLTAQEHDRVRAYRYDPRRDRFEVLPTGVDMAGSLSIAGAARRLAFVGGGAAEPPRVFALDLAGRAAPREIVRPGRDTFHRVRLPAVESFDVRLADGTIMAGRLYLPPDFDDARRYPLIVNYYGGTTPVSRNFGGRYPAELWAGLGYVVYVPQPGGAIGWGQEFAARHVNNWGITVAGEIVEGTRALLAARGYIDADRVGCIGASYGGFMTMLLTAQTDIFAGCVAHAGISSISSYWGQGWWGYSYSAAATAHSYPWNRPDIYVQQSPLFLADRINTPLLLLHGTADTNVPPGESEQLYTALTLLGREVEYVRVEGEDHQIVQYPKRQLWMETIVAWFDRTLRGDGSYWDHLFPE
jgi:dipeptidyl aminopeptidase/acylaminoacyl peptidase